MLLASRRVLSTALLRRAFATLPTHKVLGLPALSPTMTQGNLGKWVKKEGDKVRAGDRIAEVGDATACTQPLPGRHAVPCPHAALHR